MATMNVTEAARIQAEIEAGALFVVNHSGGKDSQAMLCILAGIIPAKQLLVVHASLGEIEWDGALELARDQAAEVGVPFVVARAEKSFLDMVERRFASRPEVPSWPSAEHRQCTSDLKRGPIEREVRRFAKANGFTRIVNCMGVRAAESVARSKQKAWQRNNAQSIAGREWNNWLPIHHLSTEAVFETIRAAGQKPHWAYEMGNERLSCLFCILGSANDARNGAIHNPDVYSKFVELEARTGYTAHQSRRALTEITGLTVEEARAEHARRAALTAEQRAFEAKAAQRRHLPVIAA